MFPSIGRFSNRQGGNNRLSHLIIEGAKCGGDDSSRSFGPSMVRTESGFLSGMGSPSKRQRASKISGREQQSRNIVAGATRIQMILAKCQLPLP
jgi:hypothetical protein